ncbi:MAG: acyl-protein synthetase [Gemmatimonadota bacterium]|nr:acyl-protein synthetase [Gemmatimonadota bacterium]MDH5758025.1 acyl-protein synthetase [Gemmatimonadota bacterium]
MERFDEAVRELEALFRAGGVAVSSPDAFDAWALRCFAVQYDGCDPYRALCDARGVTPANVDRWEDVPAVPATAFKHLDLVVGAPEAAELVFRTSGTTAGPGGRGRHYVSRAGLYRAACVTAFRSHLLPDGVRPHLLSLVPSPGDAPHSSLSHMMGMVAEELCSASGWYVDGTGSLDVEGFVEAADRAEAPVVVAGTAFSFVHLLDALSARGGGVVLPSGSRVMETGGFKGRSREVSRDDLYGMVHTLLGVPPVRVVNEYGMTELLSQLYEPVLTMGEAGRGLHRPPPWLAVRALDPVSLDPVPEGSVGLLAFFDLANLGSISHLLTQDVGSVTPEGVRLTGRLPGAEPRGCSRAMDELLAASS